MSQPNPEHESQKQDNLVEGNTVGGDLNFAPQQIDTYIETQIVEISVDKITQQPLIKTSPYKGLKRFNLGDREYFFGRDTLIAKLFNAVNKSNFSLVLGASGSGKSSVVRAGLIPELKKSLESQKFYDFIFTPNQDPFESLYRCLLSEEKDYRFSESDVDFVREGKPNTLPQLISKLNKNEERWFIFIDQFEQLFINIDSEKRNNFIQGIVQVAAEVDSSVRIVLAMRSDFLEQFSYYSALGAIANKNNIHLVTEMYPDELRQAIEQPAAKNGVVFEKGLVEQIIKEVEGQKGYLPLLQYTLDLLWEKECTTKAADGRFHIEDRILNKVSYVALGGVRGALQKRVDEIYTDICEKNEDGELVTKQIFLKLVNIVESESGSRAVSRRAYRNEFVDKPIESTLKRFINENLLVSNYEYSSEDKLLVGNSKKFIQYATVEIAHEILLSSWDKLKSWLEDEKEAIILKNWLANETRRWLKVRALNKAKASDELLKGSRLDQIVEFRGKNAFEKLGGLVPEENELIDNSVKLRERVEKQKQITRLRIIAGLTLGLVIISGFAIWAEYQRRLANYREKNNKSLQLATASEASLNVDTTRSLLLAIQANIIQETPQAAYALWQAFQENHERFQMMGHKGEVIYAEFDPNNYNRILTISDDKTARIWNLENLDNSIILKGHRGNILHGTFAKENSNRVLTVSSDGTAKVWDLNEPDKPLIILTGHQGAINYGTFAPTNDNRVLTVSSDRTARVWDISIPTAPKVVQVFKGHNAGIFHGSFDPANANRILTVSGDSTARIWDLNKSQTPLVLKGHVGAVLYGSFDPKNSNRVLTVSDDKNARVWDLSVPNSSIVLEGHQKAVLHGNFDPKNSNRVLTVSDDKTVRIWDIDNPKNPKILTGHQDSINYINFNPKNPNQFLTVSSDKTTKIWDINSSNPLLTLYGHKGKVVFGTFHPNKENRILTTSDDRTARIWNISEKAYQELPSREGTVHRGIVSGIFNPENPSQVITIARDGTLKYWNINDSEESYILTKKLGSIDYAQIDLNNPKRIATVNPTGLGKINVDKQKRRLRTRHKVESVSFDSKNPHRILVVSGSTATVWNIKNNASVNLSAPPLPMNQGEFDPNDSNRLATGGADGILRIWNLKNPTKPQKELTASQKEIWHVSFDPQNSNRILVLGSDGLAKILNIQTGKETNLTGHTNTVAYGSFDPNNSNRVLTVSHDGTARIWNIENLGNPLILKGSKQRLIYGIFDPKNSNRVLTVSSDGDARIYIVGGKELSESAWNRTSRCFSGQELSDYKLSKVQLLKTLSIYLQKSAELLSSQKFRPYC